MTFYLINPKLEIFFFFLCVCERETTDSKKKYQSIRMQWFSRSCSYWHEKKEKKKIKKKIVERPHFTALFRARCSPDGERRYSSCVVGLHLLWYPAVAREKLLLPSHCPSAQLLLRVLALGPGALPTQEREQEATSNGAKLVTLL